MSHKVPHSVADGKGTRCRLHDWEDEKVPRDEKGKGDGEASPSTLRGPEEKTELLALYPRPVDKWNRPMSRSPLLPVLVSVFTC